jgi:hypothetical protein
MWVSWCLAKSPEKGDRGGRGGVPGGPKNPKKPRKKALFDPPPRDPENPEKRPFLTLFEGTLPQTPVVSWRGHFWTIGCIRPERLHRSRQKRVPRGTHRREKQGGVGYFFGVY